MRHAVALALALTLGGAPVANMVCAAWCDAHDSKNGNAGNVCHSELAHHLRAVFANLDACDAFASSTFIREDTRRVARDTVPIAIAFLPATLTVPEPCLNGGTLAGTPRLRPDRALVLALRI
jgi:hypothetical protein